jgi:hypothetical protein
MPAPSGSIRSSSGVAAAVRAQVAKRVRRGRTGVVVAALFAGLTVIGGSAGFVIGAVASLGAEHHPDGAAFHPEGVQGEAGGSLEGPDRN